jgi:phage terminase small subunit
MRGGKPTSTALKILRGNPGKRPLNTAEPHPSPLDPAIPEELLGDVARAEWVRTVQPAITIGQLTSLDRALAIAHCDLWMLWRQALVDAHAAAKVSARRMALATATKLLTSLIRIDGDLGFSPASRPRVKATVPVAAPPTERFFGRRA